MEEITNSIIKKIEMKENQKILLCFVALTLVCSTQSTIFYNEKYDQRQLIGWQGLLPAQRQQFQITADTQTNFIRNSDFSLPVLTSNFQIFKSLPEWETNEVEKGVGSIYNRAWGDTQVIELDGNQNNFIRQRINLRRGRYIIEIKYAARAGYVSSSSMSIYWNGKAVRNIVCTDQSVKVESIEVEAVDGENIIEIRGEGKSDSYGITVAYVKLTYSGPTADTLINYIRNYGFPSSAYQFQVTADTQTNFIRNSDFSLPVLTSNFQIFKSLPEWEINEVEKGVGSIYNRAWGDTQVIELDGNQNNFIRQRINLRRGRYIIEIKYAARAGYVSSSSMSIYWNGKAVRNIVCTDQSVKVESIEVEAVDGENIIEIRGEGKSDSYGITVAYVKLTYSGPTAADTLINYIRNYGFYGIPTY